MGRMRSGSKLNAEPRPEFVEEDDGMVDIFLGSPCKTKVIPSNQINDKKPDGSDDSVFLSSKLNENDTKAQLFAYKRRWYILGLFSIIAFMQYCCWNTYGPISNTVKTVFGWTNSEIALLASLDPITYILTSLLFSYVMDVKGLRLSMLISMVFMFLGTGLRCVTSQSSIALWTMTMGQFLNGLAGPVTQAAPPLLSSQWFPPEQRTTATAIGSLCGSLGVALSFVIGPLLVHDIDSASFRSDFWYQNVNNTNQSIPVLDETLLPSSFPLIDEIYGDAVHHWPLDELNITINDYRIDKNTEENSLTRFEIWTTKETITVRDHKTGHEGRVFGFVRLQTGVENNSIETDGEHAWLNLGNYVESCISQPERCTQGFSVSLWLFSSNFTQLPQYHLGTSGIDPGYRGFSMYQIEDGIHVSVGIGYQRWSARFSTLHDSWCHVAFTWNKRQGLNVYVNGTWAARDSLGTTTTPIVPYYTTLTLGKSNNRFDSLFSRARYDELAIWHRVLHPKEIAVLSGKVSPTRVVPPDNEEVVPKRIPPDNEEVVQERIHTLENKETEALRGGKTEVMNLLYIEFGIVTALFLAVVLYFPDGPPTPPSNSAAAEREDFYVGVKQLARNCQFWTVTLAYGITTGIYSGWGAVLAVNLQGFGVGQNEAGWIGFYATLAGIGAGLLLARCADFFGGHMKALLLFLFVGSSSCFLWFSLLCLNIITFTTDAMYKSSILGGFFVSGTIPLFYEISVESTYPVAEGVTCSVMTLINNIFTVIFLLILMIPGVGTLWMNWLLFGSCAISIPVLMTFTERYRRLEIDMTDNCEKTEQAEEPCSIPTPLGSLLSVRGENEIVQRFKISKESTI